MSRFRGHQCRVPTSAIPEERLPTSDILRAALEVASANSEGDFVLAISGGRDSMALLHAMARWAPHRIKAVATYDHGTGSYATDAASLVAAEARRLGLTTVRERARSVMTTEAQWRDARWAFLHRVARAYGGRIATAHTRDDQLETVVIRALRGAGARGLAALAAPSPIVRPWLGVSRAEIDEWVRAEAIPFTEDPTNATPRFLRGRIRNELLPAFEHVAPGFASHMLGLGEQAASWRRGVEALVDELAPTMLRAGVLRVHAHGLDDTTDEGRAVLWPALFARVGVVLDARGTRELVRFTTGKRRGAMVTLAKGAVALRTGGADGDTFELRRGAALERRSMVWSGPAALLPGRLGGWRFRRAPVPTMSAEQADNGGAPERWSDPWYLALPPTASLSVRPWAAGDRIQTLGARTGRRVTRYFAEAQVPALDRPGWPVVLMDNEMVWVPGICRSLAAPNRPGRPDLIWYRCEREHD